MEKCVNKLCNVILNYYILSIKYLLELLKLIYIIKKKLFL
jgi:hypothetical protein